MLSLYSTSRPYFVQVEISWYTYAPANFTFTSSLCVPKVVPVFEFCFDPAKDDSDTTTPVRLCAVGATTRDHLGVVILARDD